MTPDSNLNLRLAQPEDCDILFELIKGLAEYEKLTDAVTGSASQLQEHLFGSIKYAEVILAEIGGKVVGFALFFHNYSTFLTQPGIYLEDLFILEEYRQQGIGKALLTKVASIAVQRNCGRLEWSVLNWNEPAKAFYRHMGADILEDWQICRVSGEQLKEFGVRS